MHIRIGYLILLSLLSTLILAPNLVAGENAPQDEAFTLPEVVVTASAIIEKNEVNRLGSQITMITKDQIADLNAMDLTSALRRIPGVIISRHNPVGSFGGGEGGALFIRGHGSSRPGAEIQNPYRRYTKICQRLDAPTDGCFKC